MCRFLSSKGRSANDRFLKKCWAPGIPHPLPRATRNPRCFRGLGPAWCHLPAGLPTSGKISASASLPHGSRNCSTPAESRAPGSGANLNSRNWGGGASSLGTRKRNLGISGSTRQQDSKFDLDPSSSVQLGERSGFDRVRVQFGRT